MLSADAYRELLCRAELVHGQCEGPGLGGQAASSEALDSNEVVGEFRDMILFPNCTAPFTRPLLPLLLVGRTLFLGTLVPTMSKIHTEAR